MRLFNKNDIGCYADATFGHQHCREVLADVLNDAWNEGAKPYTISEKYKNEIIASLRSVMSDDVWEEEEALDILNTHFVTDDVYFGFVDGDLMCLSTNDEED